MDPDSVLFVHDARSRACDGLIARLADLLEVRSSAAGLLLSGSRPRAREAAAFDLQVVVSAQHAAEALRGADAVRGGARDAVDGAGDVKLAFVCLDLQPAPVAGTRIAEFAVARGIPVVLVTRSTRWLPQGSALNAVPWISPDATSEELVDAMRAALDSDRASGETTYDGERDSLDRVSIGF